MLKVGIIGLGNIGVDAHLAAYNKIKNESGPVEVVAVCDELEERLSEVREKGYSFREYLSIDEMLKAERGKLDFVDICIPTYLHAEVAIKAMEMGFNVLCEKPMAMNVEEANAMLEAKNRTGKLLMIAYCNRFYKGARFVKDVVDSGELGKPLYAEFRHMGDSIRPQGRNKNKWFWDKNLSGGGALDYHIHNVDLIRWMFGVPKAVSVAGISTDDAAVNGYDILSANLMYDGMWVNAIAQWTGPNRMKYDGRVIHVNFENGYVRCERTAGRDVIEKSVQDGEGKVISSTTHNELLPFSAYYDEIVYFCDCLIGGKEPIDDLPEDSVDSIKIVMAEIESADKGGEKIVIK